MSVADDEGGECCECHPGDRQSCSEAQFVDVGGYLGPCRAAVAKEAEGEDDAEEDEEGEVDDEKGC